MLLSKFRTEIAFFQQLPYLKSFFIFYASQYFQKSYREIKCWRIIVFLQIVDN